MRRRRVAYDNRHVDGIDNYFTHTNNNDDDISVDRGDRGDCCKYNIFRHKECEFNVRNKRTDSGYSKR